MLGPVRFTHIEHCARDAILRSRQVEAQVEQAKKKQRTADEDEKTRVSLAQTLQERDQSITVLRALLVEKTVGASAEPGENVTGAQHPTPTKQIDYSVMPLQALKQLDKARDATIAWILKKIDEAEEEQAKITPTSPPKTTAELRNKSDDPHVAPVLKQQSRPLFPPHLSLSLVPHLREWHIRQRSPQA